MDWTAIIQRFNLQVDDSSELSDDESLALAQEVYSEIQNDRNWVWLRKSFSGTTSSTVPYVSLPTDFKTLSSQYDGVSIVYVGTQPRKYRVISYDNRRDYTNTDGYCYIDIPNSRLVFTKQPNAAETLEYDYICVAPLLTASTSPLFTENLHDVISYWMAYLFANIEQTDKAQSYQDKNEKKYLNKLSQLRTIDTKTKLAMS